MTRAVLSRYSMLRKYNLYCVWICIVHPEKGQVHHALKWVDEAHIHEPHSKLQWTGLGFPDGLCPFFTSCRISASPGQIVRLSRFSLNERRHTGQREGAVAQDFDYFSGRLYQISCYKVLLLYQKLHCSLEISNLAVEVAAQHRLSTFPNTAAWQEWICRQKGAEDLKLLLCTYFMLS